VPGGATCRAGRRAATFRSVAGVAPEDPEPGGLEPGLGRPAPGRPGVDGAGGGRGGRDRHPRAPDPSSRRGPEGRRPPGQPVEGGRRRGRGLGGLGEGRAQGRRRPGPGEPVRGPRATDIGGRHPRDSPPQRGAAAGGIPAPPHPGRRIGPAAARRATGRRCPLCPDAARGAIPPGGGEPAVSGDQQDGGRGVPGPALPRGEGGSVRGVHAAGIAVGKIWLRRCTPDDAWLDVHWYLRRLPQENPARSQPGRPGRPGSRSVFGDCCRAGWCCGLHHPFQARNLP